VSRASFFLLLRGERRAAGRGGAAARDRYERAAGGHERRGGRRRGRVERERRRRRARRRRDRGREAEDEVVERHAVVQIRARPSRAVHEPHARDDRDRHAGVGVDRDDAAEDALAVRRRDLGVAERLAFVAEDGERADDRQVGIDEDGTEPRNQRGRVAGDERHLGRVAAARRVLDRRPARTCSATSWAS
jgi:hypothetical protein